MKKCSKMKTLYFDCFAGASGDMIAGAFLDLGLDFNYLKAELSKLPLTGYEVKKSQISKKGILSTSFEVFVDSVKHDLVLADSEFFEADLPTNQESADHQVRPHSHESHYSLDSILSVVRQSTTEDKIKSDIEKVFLRLGQAEATVHGMGMQDIHLHEVGAIDAIIDIATAAIGFNWLQADEIVLSPIHLGSGFISSSHGMLPVPAPATAELIKGMSVYSTNVKGELLTPTGAAILSTFATDYGPMPQMTIEKIGCGAGKRERDFPNVLRVFLGEKKSQTFAFNRNPSPKQHYTALQPGGYHESDALILVANIDDMNPQLFGNLMEKLLEAGVMDITFTPVFMKKNRPATSLEVMIDPENKDKILSIIFSESTTIGVRSFPVKKHMLQREILTVNSEFGPARVKVSRLGERIINIQPEYEDCVRISDAYHISIKEVYQQIFRATSFLTTDSSE